MSNQGNLGPPIQGGTPVQGAPPQMAPGHHAPVPAHTEPLITAHAKAPRGGRRLPIAVAAGLAFGVFGGLLLVRGPVPASEASEAIAATDTADGRSAGTEASPDDAPAPAEGPPVTKVEPADTPNGAAVAPAPAAGNSGPGAAVATAKPAEPKIATARVEFDIRPKRVMGAEGFSLTVDGKPVTGLSLEVELKADGKPVPIEVIVAAPGFFRATRTRRISADKKITISLKKRTPRKSGPGADIDL